MKKTLALLLSLAACTAFAAVPVEKTITHASTPIQLGADEYHHLFPKEYGVHGLRLNCYFVENRFMYGLDLGFWNVSEDAGGIQLALYRNETHDFGGIQLSLWNTETKNVGGAQVALVTSDADDVSGLQLTGLLGKAGAVNGFQLAGISAVSESESDAAWMSGVQFGLYEARAENLRGIQLSGVFSDAGWDAKGLQLGLIFADARYVHGIQLAGIVAESKETSGVQIGGLMARSAINTKGLLQAGLLLAETGELGDGLQLAGVAANVSGASDGVQIGILSTSAGSLSGIEIAGGWNFVFEEAHGAQLALLYNHARIVHGLQLGLINHCEQLNGVQIGLLNTVKESSLSICPLLRVNF